MNTPQLVDAMARAANIEKTVARLALDALVVAIRGAVNRGNTVKLQGLGKFARIQRPAREGINPRTREAIRVAASKGIRFAPSPVAKKIINGRA